MMRTRKLLPFLFSGLLALAPYAQALTVRTDQAMPVCESKRQLKHFLKDYDALSAEDKHWIELHAEHESKRDYDGDGIEDRLNLVVTPYTRKCGVESLLLKEWMMTLELSSKPGHKHEFYIVSPAVPTTMETDLAHRVITLHGTTKDGALWERQLPY